MKAEREGDAVAYEGLLREVGRGLRPFIRGRVLALGLPAAEAEDILQEVLIGLHVMRRRWDETRPFLPWLYAILRYKLTDAVRRRARERRGRVDLSEVEWQAIVDETARTDGAMTTEVLDQALATLPAGQRRVVEAVAVEGASVRETAAALAVSEGAVRMTMHRAFKTLAALAGGQK